MPHIIAQSTDDTGLVPKLNSSAEARKKLRCGHNKWERIKLEIERVRIGPKDFWTDEALADYVRRQTVRAADPEAPRRALPRKPVPVPPKGRRRLRRDAERAVP
jgi:hypothetical protein